MLLFSNCPYIYRNLPSLFNFWTCKTIQCNEQSIVILWLNWQNDASISKRINCDYLKLCVCTYLSILWILSSMVAEMRNLCTVVGLVWPILWTLPIACNSWAGFKMGSINSTWLASIKFNPFAPEVIGNNNTLTSSLFWKSNRKKS